MSNPIYFTHHSVRSRDSSSCSQAACALLILRSHPLRTGFIWPHEGCIQYSYVHSSLRGYLSDPIGSDCWKLRFRHDKQGMRSGNKAIQAMGTYCRGAFWSDILRRIIHLGHSRGEETVERHPLPSRRKAFIYRRSNIYTYLEVLRVYTPSIYLIYTGNIYIPGIYIRSI